ncbi:hypothetical protein [Blastopirellula marina]|uniref:Uncharacterized protein n=1 Tax=Blastopirellula marina TaxID=124 RepID=A0A2S8GCC8_9BACT|nr:hypothetical protein [Blastopirellula marina]PQO42122.1 hypothetical protein C5Y93_27635 [Blastopirellula marina]
MANRKTLVQWSIGELIGVLTVGMAVVGLLWAENFVFRLVMLLALLIPVAWLIIAVTGRSEWRTFGIGSILAVLCFGAGVILTHNQVIRGMDGSILAMPTLSVSAYARQFIERDVFYVDGERLPNSHQLTIDEYGTVSDADENVIGAIAGSVASRGGTGAGLASTREISVRTLPSPNT